MYKGEVVRHLCDTPQCCNPDHVEFGTYSQNTIECLKYSKRCKLDEIKVKEIKNLLKDTHLSQADIASRYHVNQQEISRIKCGIRWSHVTI